MRWGCYEVCPQSICTYKTLPIKFSTRCLFVLEILKFICKQRLQTKVICATFDANFKHKINIFVWFSSTEPNVIIDKHNGDNYTLISNIIFFKYRGGERIKRLPQFSKKAKRSLPICICNCTCVAYP